MQKPESIDDLKALGMANGVSYRPAELDEFAVAVTRLAGDSLALGDSEFLVLGWVRDGLISPREALRLYAKAYGQGINGSPQEVSFDPFRDQGSRGYLRNHYKASDPNLVKMLEHLSYTIGLAQAQKYLAAATSLGYSELLGVHRIVFDALYPWAGRDRMETSPSLSISKGSSRVVRFAEPSDIARAVAYALKGTVIRGAVRKNPGAILGNLAYAHPFLDGNGRALLTFVSELFFRSGFAIRWNSIDKSEYLKALTDELDNPEKGIMDAFLLEYAVDISNRDQLISAMADKA